MTVLPRLCMLVLAVVLVACGQQRQDMPPVLDTMPPPPPAAVVKDTMAVPPPMDSATITEVVTMVTSKGTVTIGLYGDDAPRTVANFLALVRKRFYDGIHVHRIAPDFVIQAGDPRTKDPSVPRSEWGKAGQTADGRPLPEELDSMTASFRMGYVEGTVAMARTKEPGSGTSQFFVCMKNAAVLPRQSTIFGRVVDGMDVVHAIARTPVEAGGLGPSDGMPSEPVVIRSIRVVRR